jgi:hypothetical protein
MKISSVQLVNPVHIPGLQGTQAVSPKSNPRQRGYTLDWTAEGVRLGVPGADTYLIPFANVACVILAEDDGPADARVLRDAMEALEPAPGNEKRAPAPPPKGKRG